MRRTTAVSWLAVPCLAAALLVGPGARDASGQPYFGVQGSFGTEMDFGVGASVLANIENVNLEGVASFNLFFPDEGDFWDLNGNLFYHFHLPDTRSVLPYVGGGLNIARLSNGAGNTEVGLNLGGGVRFPSGNITPFLEGRYVVSDFDQFVITGGLFFGPARGR